MSGVLRIFSHKIYLFIYKVKSIYFMNDVTVFCYSFLVFGLGIFLYFISPFVGEPLQLLVHLPLQWTFKEFISFWVSTVGLLITGLVSLKLSLRKTEDAQDFIEILSGELSRTPSGQEFGILVPNLNLAQYYYPDEFLKFREIINTATSKGVKIKFIVPSINWSYIDSYSSLIDHHDKLGFFKKGQCNNSLSLQYIYDRYGNNLTVDKCDSTISFFLEIYKNNKVTVAELSNPDFVESKIIGFYSNHVAFIGKYSDLQSKNKRVTVHGEVIDVTESVDLIEQYFFKSVVANFS